VDHVSTAILVLAVAALVFSLAWLLYAVADLVRNPRKPRDPPSRREGDR